MPGQHGKQHAHDGNGCGVVEQRFALHQPDQPCRRAHVAKHRDYSGRIGRGNHRAEQQARDDAERRDGRRSQPDHARGNHHGHDGQHQDRRGIRRHASYIHRQCCLKQQRRQEQPQIRLCRPARIDQWGEEGGRKGWCAVPQHHIGAADADARQRQQGRFRQRQTRGQHLHQRHHGEQTARHQQQDDDAVHEAVSRAASQSARSASVRSGTTAVPVSAAATAASSTAMTATACTGGTGFARWPKMASRTAA